MPNVIMPRLSDSMEEATILSWLVAHGERVTAGQEIAEIETDKATMTYEAELDGVLHHVAAEGDTVALGALIATIGDGDALETPATSPGDPVDGDPPGVATSRAMRPAPVAIGAHEPTVEESSPATRVKASPVARRLANGRGVDLNKLTGTGRSGRIVKADVLAAATEAATRHNGHAADPPGPDLQATAPSPPPSSMVPSPVPVRQRASAARGAVERQEPSRAQQVVARRMAEAKATVPEFTLSIDVDVDACVTLREQLRYSGTEGRPVPSFNDFVVKACAIALREHPRANGSYRDGGFELHERVNVGIAVAGDETLVVPTIFDADGKSLNTIAAESRVVAARVREGTITPPELAGGTFSVSNLGMFGIDRFSAIINPPQAGILAVGAIVERPVVRDGELGARRSMTMTLTADHRILYGRDATAFIGRVRELLQQPLNVLAG